MAMDAFHGKSLYCKCVCASSKAYYVCVCTSYNFYFICMMYLFVELYKSLALHRLLKTVDYYFWSLTMIDQMTFHKKNSCMLYGYVLSRILVLIVNNVASHF